MPVLRPLTVAAAIAAALIVLVPAAWGKTLAPPKLAAPAAEASLDSVPAFSWSPVKNADRYEFQLAADQAFGSIALGAGKGSFQTRNTQATVASSLPDGDYWWRVRAIAAAGKAGKWSAARPFNKTWATKPVPTSPVSNSPVVFPSTPLVFRWAGVPRAFKYRLYIGSDPSLGSLVLVGDKAGGPIETSGTVYAPAVSLPPGRYFWAVEAVDFAGHRGTRSDVESFTWSWPSATQPFYSDLIGDPRVADPHWSWASVPGAVAYELEVNPSEDFAAGSKVCCAGQIRGTEFSSPTILPNNVYHWRVRAIDPDGNAGQWNLGPDFDKNFGNVPPTIPNLILRDPDHSDHAADLDPNTPVVDTSAPVIQWSPVPGAASYEVQMVPVEFGACNWTTNTKPERWVVETAATAWTPLSGHWNGKVPGGLNFPAPSYDHGGQTGIAMVDGHQYCVRVHAVSGNHSVMSDWTQIGSAGQPTFQYQAPSIPDVSGQLTMGAGDYLGPQSGTLTPRLPLFTWKPIPGAHSYWVVVSKSQTFTEIVDVGLTNIPAYAPRADALPRTYSDENTNYFWAVLPAHSVDGDGVSSDTSENNPQTFQKLSIPPALLSPTAGADVFGVPVFRWTTGDAATAAPEGAREYLLQVAQDPSFANPIDQVTTQSLSYTGGESYPADTVLYWRVRVNDVNKVGLRWSATGTFQRRLSAPSLVADNPTGGSVIPALLWQPVTGASSYDVHVDQADGTRKDFNLRGTAFTPTTFYGTGVWHWQVRANFADASGKAQSSSGYTSPVPFTRRIPAPESARSRVANGGVLLSWDPVVNAREYRVEVSRSNSFSTVDFSTTTQNTDFAPLLTEPAFVNGGTFFWRVAAIDEGKNVGAFATAALKTTPRLVLQKGGFVARLVPETVTITVLDPSGHRVKGARVTVSGVAHARAHRTGRRGTTAFRIRAAARGVVRFRATKSRYLAGTLEQRVY